MKNFAGKLIILSAIFFTPVVLSAQTTRSNPYHTAPASNPNAAANHLQNYSSTGSVVSSNDVVNPGLNPDVPIDNGVLLLVAAGAMLGSFKIYQAWKKKLSAI